VNIDGSGPDRLPVSGTLGHERFQRPVVSNRENETLYPET